MPRRAAAATVAAYTGAMAFQIRTCSTQQPLRPPAVRATTAAFAADGFHRRGIAVIVAANMSAMKRATDTPAEDLRLATSGGGAKRPHLPFEQAVDIINEGL